jgi:hypothetical protein
MTREEHLAWAKTRALEYLDQDQPSLAVASMTSDLAKHPETVELLTVQALEFGTSAACSAAHELRGWIESFQ